MIRIFERLIHCSVDVCFVMDLAE